MLATCSTRIFIKSLEIRVIAHVRKYVDVPLELLAPVYSGHQLPLNYRDIFQLFVKLTRKSYRKNWAVHCTSWSNFAIRGETNVGKVLSAKGECVHGCVYFITGILSIIFLDWCSYQ